MRNPLIKNNKTWVHGDLHHRVSHYNKILNTKSFIKKLSPPPISFYGIINCKRAHSETRQNQNNNMKLIASLHQIEENPGFYNKRQFKFNNKTTLRNQYLDHQQAVKLSADNLRLYQKINSATSDLGSVGQWKKKQKVRKKYKRLLKNSRKDYLDIDEEFYTSFERAKSLKKNISMKIEDIVLEKNMKQKTKTTFRQSGTFIIEKFFNRKAIQKNDQKKR